MQPLRAVNLAATFSATTGVIALLIAVLAIRASGAPGAGEQRWFSAVALATAVYALGNLPLVLGAGDLAVAWASRTQFAAALLHVWAWIRFSQEFLRKSPSRLERLGAGLLATAALASLVPGLALHGPVIDRPFPALGAIYRQFETTAAGNALMALALAAAALVLARFVRAAVHGTRHALLLALSLALLLAVGTNDALAASGITDGFFLLDLGFTLPVLAIGWVLATRFVESARALERLRGELEERIVARERDLSSALEALHQSEKLAALGQFAGGVAHEVNSPAAVVTANLRYLEESLGGRSFPEDAKEVLGDSLLSMRRINDLVRKLVDAGRLATVSGPLLPVQLAEIAREVLAEARAAADPSVVLEARVPPDLLVRARREPLEQVLGALVANAVEASTGRSGGRVSVRAHHGEGTVRIEVSDEGAGMGPEVLRRVFDPFFTTKPPGRGSGLGLPVARALVEALGGRLHVRSEPGKGTSAEVVLPSAREPAPPDRG